MNGLRPQNHSQERAEARARAVEKVTRTTHNWREMYDLDTQIGVAIHHAVTENA